MKLDNNAQKVDLIKKKTNDFHNTEDYKADSRCQTSEFPVLHFPEYKSHLNNKNQNNLLFDYILVANDIDIGLFNDLIGLFEACQKKCNYDTKYVIFDLENCKIIDFQFDKLINSINIHLDECAKTESLENKENIFEIAIDFIDTQKVFLDGVISNFESFKLEKLQIDVLLPNRKQQTITKLYDNANHEFEKFLLKHIEEMKTLVSDMVKTLNLTSYQDEFETIKKFNQITKNGEKILRKKLGQKYIINNENSDFEYDNSGENVLFKQDFLEKKDNFFKNKLSTQKLNDIVSINENEYTFFENFEDTKVINIDNFTSSKVIADKESISTNKIILSVLGGLIGVSLLCVLLWSLVKRFKKNRKEEQDLTYIKYDEIEMTDKSKK